MIKIVLAILTAVITIVSTIWIYRKLWPYVELRIIPRWGNEEKDVIIFRLEVTNKSAILVRPIAAKFQVLEHQFKKSRFLPDFIPFQKKDFDELSLDKEKKDCQPIEWLEPYKLDHPVKLEPNESFATEVLYHCLCKCDALHYGFQFAYESDWPLAFLYKKIPNRRMTRMTRSDRFTTTAWIVVPEPLRTEENPVTSSLLNNEDPARKF